MGESPTRSGNRIRLDQGLDTSAISPSRALDPLLVETQYMIEMDSRLGHVVSKDDGIKASLSFVDDDSVATYYLSRGSDTDYVQEITDSSISTGTGAIKGPRGTKLVFKLQTSLELNTSDYLFDTIGSTEDITGKAGASSYKTIKTTVRVTGINTGYRIDVPVKFVKKV
jgi:hypothetical protein